MRPLLLLWLVGCGSEAGRSGSQTGPTDGSQPEETAQPGTGDPAGDPPGCSTTDNGGPLGAETCVSAAPCSWTGSQAYDYFGYALASGADFDGDGRPDLAIGAPYRDISGATETTVDAGAALILSGGRLDSPQAGLVATVPGLAAGGRMGSALALLQDLNGDGLGDLAVGAPGLGGTGADGSDLLGAGEVWLVVGQAGDVDAPPALSPTLRITGDLALGQLGSALADTGDVNGDGLSDLALNGAQREAFGDGGETWSRGKACLLLGQAGLDGDRSAADLPCYTGVNSQDAAGMALAGGDLDGDGYADLALSAPYAGGPGRVYVLPGGATDPAGGSLADAPVVLEGPTRNEAYGWALAVGDVTGDGVAELLIGAPLRDLPWGNEGAVELRGGGDLSGAGLPLLATWEGDHDDVQLGTGLHAGADHDGDGLGDLLLGSVSAWQGLRTRAGQVYRIAGRADGAFVSGRARALADRSFFGAETKDYLGRSNTAADLDGDGRAELILATAYSNVGAYDVGAVYLFFGVDGAR